MKDIIINGIKFCILHNDKDLTIAMVRTRGEQLDVKISYRKKDKTLEFYKSDYGDVSVHLPKEYYKLALKIFDGAFDDLPDFVMRGV